MSVVPAAASNTSLISGNYIFSNKAFSTYVLDVTGSQIYARERDGSDRQNWIVVNNGTVTFEAFDPSVFIHAAAEINNQPLRGDSSVSTHFIPHEPGTPGEFQFTVHNGLAMQAMGENDHVRLKPSNVHNQNQIWILESINSLD